MKTSLSIDDDVYRQFHSRCVANGRKVSDVLTEYMRNYCAAQTSPESGKHD